MGITVERRGKALRLKAPGWEKFAEIDSLGDDYKETNLRKVVAAQIFVRSRGIGGERVPVAHTLRTDRGDSRDLPNKRENVPAGQQAGGEIFASVMTLASLGT